LAMSLTILYLYPHDILTLVFCSCSSEKRLPPEANSVTISTWPLSTHAPTNYTIFGCLTLIRVEISRWNSRVSVCCSDCIESEGKRSLFIATSISL